MKRFSKLGVLFVLACSSVPVGCSSDDSKPAQGAPDGSTNPDAAAPPDGAHAMNQGIKCGSTTCAPVGGIGIEKVTQCCTDANECGLQFPGAAHCLLETPIWNANAACGDYTVPDVPSLRLTGCCAAKGCGKLDAFLGCIQNSELGLSEKTCFFDPTNDCSAITEVTCDGSEDCPTGKRCCSAIGGGGPSQTGCYDSCTTLEASDQAASWRELCHAGGTCENPQYDCRTSQNLPSWLFRCFTGLGQTAGTGLDTSAGGVNCGANLVCRNGQKCCTAQSKSSGAVLYCADANEECKCHATDGGTPSTAADAARD